MGGRLTAGRLLQEEEDLTLDLDLGHALDGLDISAILKLLQRQQRTTRSKRTTRTSCQHLHDYSFVSSLDFLLLMLILLSISLAIGSQRPTGTLLF